MPKSTSYRWKNGAAADTIYKTENGQQQAELKREKIKIEPEENEEQNVINGQRIVDLNILGQQLWCSSCTEALSLKYIESEIRKGLASQLLVQCHKCLVINEVCTSKQRTMIDKRKTHFDINSKAALGFLHSGLGWTNFKKLLACLNIPCPDFKTLKKYEQELEIAAKKVIEESCHDAVALGEKLTIGEAENIEVQL